MATRSWRKTATPSRAPADPGTPTIWALPLAWLLLPIMLLRPALDQLLVLLPFSVGPLQLSPGVMLNFIVVACGLFISAYLALTKRRSVALLLTAAIWLPFLAICMAASPVSPAPADAYRLLFNLLTYAAIFLISAAYVLPGRDPMLFRRIIVFSGIIPLAGGLVMLATGGFDARLQGVFTHPNIFAFFLLTYGGFLYHLILSGRNETPQARALYAVLLVIALVCILFTQTRSSWLGIYLFMTVYTLLARPLLVLPVIAAPMLALAVPQVSERVTQALMPLEISYDRAIATARGDVDGSESIKLDSGTWRRFLWHAAWDEAQKRPLTGHGLESFEPDSKRFFPLAAERGSGAHNIFMQLWYETGIPGLVAYLWQMAALLMIALFSRRAPWRERAFVIALILAFNLASYSDNMFNYLVVNWMFWFIVGGYSATFLRFRGDGSGQHVRTGAARRRA